MSLPPDSDVFESGIESSKPSPAIHTLIREYLEAVRSDMKMSSGSPPTPPPATISSSESAVLINELGEYFSRTARMWSSLTDSLMNGPHIDSAVSDVLQASSSKTRFVDIDAATNMDLEITRLRTIRDLTVRYSQEVQEIWRPVPLPAIQPPQNRTSIPIAKLVSPDHSYSRSDLSSLNDHRMGVPRFGDHNPMSSSQMDMDPAHSPLEDNDSESDDDEELFNGIDMESLKQRGKGNYTCPKGLRCEKGGVENGQLVVFDRNSAFLQHLNKHRRPWVCELLGCPNPLKKRKFARRDGLERHKATAAHHYAKHNRLQLRPITLLGTEATNEMTTRQVGEAMVFLEDSDGSATGKSKDVITQNRRSKIAGAVPTGSALR